MPLILANEPFDEHAQSNGETHLRRPVYLTNGCCESAWGSPYLLKSLGLKWGQTGDIVAPAGRWGNHYPLTKEEEQFIREDCVDTALACLSLGYTALYQNRKWLYPSDELVYLTDESDESAKRYYKDHEATLVDAGIKACKIESLMPECTVVVDPHMGNDRIGLSILIPFDMAFRLGGYNAYKGWLLDRLGNPSN